MKATSTDTTAPAPSEAEAPAPRRTITGRAALRVRPEDTTRPDREF